MGRALVSPPFTEGVVLSEASVNDKKVLRAIWRISHLSNKLRGCMGRALVSPPFTAYGMEDVRIMIYPDNKESPAAPRSKKQKELYNNKVTVGPLDGAVKLKVPNVLPPSVLAYYIQVGVAEKEKDGKTMNRCVEKSHNFSDCTVSPAEEFAGLDWLQEVDTEGGLTVSVDIVEPQSQ